MRLRILLDMSLSPVWVPWCAEAGIEARHGVSVGDPRANDADILAWAAASDYVPLTNDLDFGAILAATKGGKPSVLQVRTDSVMPERIGGVVLAAISAHHEALTQGPLITVHESRFRVRILPL